MENLKLVMLTAFAGLFLTAFIYPAPAQSQKTKKHRVVFEASVADEEAWQGV